MIEFGDTQAIPMPKQPLPKGKQPKSKTVKVELLPGLRNLSQFLNEKVIRDRNQDLVKMEKAELDELAAAIIINAEDANDQAMETLGCACLAIINAWNCGSLLNIAKKRTKHGDFQKWFRDTIRTPHLHLRTAQRYMKLAKRHSRLEDLVASNPSLRQAYIACGILPEPTGTEKADKKDNEVIARIGLLKSVASVRTRLRRFSTKNIKLDKKTRMELLATKAEIDQLFKVLIA